MNLQLRPACPVPTVQKEGSNTVEIHFYNPGIEGNYQRSMIDNWVYPSLAAIPHISAEISHNWRAETASSAAGSGALGSPCFQ